MRRVFGIVMILGCILPNISFANMTQDDIDQIYTAPIILGEKQATINIDLPVDSIAGYRWFLLSPNYDYIRAVQYQHQSANIDNSKYGGMDEFKLKVVDRFKKVPQKLVLHFECFKPWDDKSKPIVKDITILSL